MVGYLISLSMLGCERENMHVRTPVVFMFSSLIATCDSDEHCSMDATVTLLCVE